MIIGHVLSRAPHPAVRSALALAAVSMLSFAGIPVEASARDTVISAGVVAVGSPSAPEPNSVEYLRISPVRIGDALPDLTSMLQTAFDWCTGRVPNGFQDEYRGRATHHGCDIALDSGVYRIDRTVLLRPLRENMPMTIDLGNAVIVHEPTLPRVVSVAELSQMPCDAKTLGTYVNVRDPESFDNIWKADPEGVVEIEEIGPNAKRAPGCPEGTTRCKYGANAIRVRTRTAHGLSDGGLLGLGDVVVLSIPGTPYEGLRLLVKEVVDARTFLVTTPFPPPKPMKTGALRETETTAWCNGHRWRAGKPMIAIGGPGAARKSRLSVVGGKFIVDNVLFRTSAILVDGDPGPNRRGGAEWVEVDVTHGGNGNLRGQIVVDLGSDDPKRSLCQHISVRVDSNSWGTAWSPSVWNRTCSSTELHVRQGHGGGVWIGLDSSRGSTPRAVTLRGSLDGCYDGPCLWVRSGSLNLADGVQIFGSMWGPQGRGGPARGLLALLGTEQGNRVNIVAHGAIWGASQESDLDCYVRLGKAATFVQVGGQVVSGNREEGSGKEAMFCDTPPHRVEDFALEHVQQMSWGGRSLPVDFSSAASSRR